MLSSDDPEYQRRAKIARERPMNGVFINHFFGGPLEPPIATRPQDWHPIAREIIFGRERHRA